MERKKIYSFLMHCVVNNVISFTLYVNGSAFLSVDMTVDIG